jgi:phosphoribosylglycinamide formyltransferase 1
MLRVGVLVSGGGTNFQAISDAINNGKIPDTEIVLLISSTKNAYALERGKVFNIPSKVIVRKDYPSAEAYNVAMVQALNSSRVDVVLLAGFMKILSSTFIQAFRNRILNIHPSLIPAFSGKGYYGLKVHEAVLKKGVKVTGATVHLVNEEVDGGKILAQKAITVKENDTPETLQQRVMEEAEWQIYPEVLRDWALGNYNYLFERTS